MKEFDRRENSLGLKEFQYLSNIEQENYINELISIPKEKRDFIDNHILKFCSTYREPEQKTKKFLEL